MNFMWIELPCMHQESYRFKHATNHSVRQCVPAYVVHLMTIGPFIGKQYLQYFYLTVSAGDKERRETPVVF